MPNDWMAALRDFAKGRLDIAGCVLLGGGGARQKSNDAQIFNFGSYLYACALHCTPRR
jgi:hypothetical protein